MPDTHYFTHSEGPAVVDFTQPNGRIRRELTCTNISPIMSSRFSSNPMYINLRSYASRTHDWALNNRGQRVCDTHHIFPLEHLDPADERNYYFKATDALLKNTMDCGTKIYFRLGTSIEHTPDAEHFNTIIPQDFDHYAEVCAGIIRHYTRGWANGYHWDIKYWEIWNEADLGIRMWAGTEQQFIDFYVIVLKRLQAEFPELKIGGPAYCTIYRDWNIHLMDRLQQENLKPDFYSFHCYSGDVYTLMELPYVARKLLDEHGMTNTEVHINEWHYLPPGLGCNFPISTPDDFEQNMAGPLGMHGICAGAHLAATIIGWHDTPIDMSFFYGAGPEKAPAGMYGLVNYYSQPNKKYYALKMLCDAACDTPNRVVTSGGDKNIWMIAGTDDAHKNAQIIVSDYLSTMVGDIKIQLKGIENPKAIRVFRLSNLDDVVEQPVDFQDGILTLKKKYALAAVFQIQISL